MAVTDSHFVKMLCFLLADRLENFGMAAGFGKLSTKKAPQKNVRTHHIYIKTQNLLCF